MAGEVFWVTFLAGVGGTGLGGVAGGLFRRESERTVSLLLSFAAGVMVAVVCFDLLAEAAAPGRLFPVAAGILAGYGVTAGLGYLLERRRRQESRLLLAGLVMGAAIALHNLPEGMAIGASFAGGGGGWAMAAVIGLHNVPEGMAVAAPLVAGGRKRRWAAALAALAGVPTVLGAALGYGLGTMGPLALTTTLSFAAGAMLYVVFGELLPEAEELWRSRVPAVAAVAGVVAGLIITRG
ncbi:ZIP family metal transporter [uncultured Dysosmobacter sp.]|uniref:ZIP family metal transporter n=1 Tax=uncultured Dysosmobacter sp. TaxID=2591384 RepID=UPI002628FF5D|nr:ZIP family metal transporter [uncultured Dysosmobacter sp.]